MNRLRQITIDDEYITLGQLLKKLDIIDTGGQAKGFLAGQQVKVNGTIEYRRGKKLYPQDIVDIEGFGTIQLTQA